MKVAICDGSLIVGGTKVHRCNDRPRSPDNVGKVILFNDDESWGIGGGHMSIPKSISRDHVLKMLEVIDREGVPGKYQARNTFLLWRDREYPVKYVIFMAAKLAGIELSITDFTTVEAKNYLKKLGFEVIEDKWDVGVSILRKTADTFIKRALHEGLSVSKNMLCYFSKKAKTTPYYQLKLPPELRVSSSLVHFEWLARLEEESARFSVGLHLEFPGEQRELNRRLGDLILERVDLKELERKVGVPVERGDKKVYPSSHHL
ncbi:hypothetical protein [Thermococcus stetteri]|uniref:hypothetical protein n=1 Tax=Thermococcus stetteri TaxID=49900 RepID=UPI001AE49576|nr:hypothetical protein [Thermococcus stetteri]MBP1912966.1 hypothetical protein [Thermococcus stetteri]